MKIYGLWLTVFVFALAWGRALGQASAPLNDSQSTGSTILQEIVITAERRPTNLQTTAIAATVLSGAELAEKGVTNVDDLQFVMPSVTIQNFGQGNFFNIRGIGKSENNTGTTVGVITYRDGVATFPGFFQDEPYYDLASVEVLRGPQGTFVGQNATGGAVLITEKNPVIGGGYQGYLQGQVGNYTNVGAQGAVNLPISDTLAARVAFDEDYRDSFYEFTGDHTGTPGLVKESSLRFSLLWRPDDALSVLWKNDFNYINQGGYAADPFNAPEDPFHIGNNAHNLALDEFVRSVLKVDYLLSDGITLRSVSGFQKGRTAFDGDLDGTDQLGFTFRNDVFETIYSQEFNILSPDSGFFTWVVGAYYQHDEYNYPYPHFDIGLPPGGLDEQIYGTNPNQTAAGFGQVNFNLSHGFQLQVGLRYTSTTSTNNATIAIPEFGVALPDQQTEKSSRLTGKVALNWTVDPNNFLYAFVATGYKSGGLNTPTGPVLPATFGPETVTDYEFGWKATSLDGHLRTQIGGYYNDYNNFQVTIGNPTNPTASTEINNPSTTKIYGFEATAQGVFGPFSLDGGLSLLRSRLGTFFATDPRIKTITPCGETSGPSSPSCIDLSGHEQNYAPTLTFNMGAQYGLTVSNGDTLTPRVNFSHIARQWATVFENAALGDSLSARNLLDAQLAYQHRDYTFTLYGSNLTNQEYVSAINGSLRYEGPPRQYGLRAQVNF
jgi:iron complex outermembrane receptor protein